MADTDPDYQSAFTAAVGEFTTVVKGAAEFFETLDAVAQRLKALAARLEDADPAPVNDCSDSCRTDYEDSRPCGHALDYTGTDCAYVGYRRRADGDDVDDKPCRCRSGTADECSEHRR